MKRVRKAHRNKVFKNGPRKICGKQPLKKLKEYVLLKLNISLQRPPSKNFTWSILDYFVPYRN